LSVIDASVVVMSVIDERGSDLALELLESGQGDLAAKARAAWPDTREPMTAGT
jgi:hypothetical protein